MGPLTFTFTFTFTFLLLHWAAEAAIKRPNVVLVGGADDAPPPPSQDIVPSRTLQAVCELATSSFSAALSIRLQGDPSAMDETSRTLLGQLFQDSYNTGNCNDPSHRTITSIQVLSLPSNQDDEILLEYAIGLMYCQECHGGELDSLFDSTASSGAGRSMLGGEDDLEELATDFARGEDDDKKSRKSVVSQSSRRKNPPYTEPRDLHKKKSKSSRCDETPVNLNSNIQVTLLGDLPSVGLHHLGYIFQLAYNCVRDDACDPFVNTVSTTHVRQRRRRLKASVFLFSVDFMCSRCEHLFDASFTKEDVIDAFIDELSWVGVSVNGADINIIGDDPTNGCGCTADEEQQQGFTTEAEFQSVYAQELNQAKEKGIISGVDGVKGISNIVSISCADTINEFETTSFVQLSGSDPTQVQVAEVRALEGGFQGSYNHLQALFCDDFERTVKDASFELSNARRGLQLVPGLKPNLLLFSYRVSVNGTCRGCAPQSSLFGDDAARRLLTRSESFPSKQYRLLADTPGTCFCTSDSLENGIRAPSEDEFLVEYNNTVKELAAQGILKNVGAVADVASAEEVDCPIEAKEFEATSFVELNGDPDAVSLREIIALELGFSGTYNELQDNFCDEFFRKISGSQFELSGVRRLGKMERDLQLLQNFILFSYRVRTNYTCFGCPPETRLFGDDAARRKLRSSFSSRTLQKEPSGASCFCSSASLANGKSAPSEQAFVGAYNETVVALAESGELQNVNGVSGIAEVYESKCEGHLTPFFSTVFMDLETDPSGVTLSELTTLGQAFGSTYNDLQTEYCDPLQRTVTTAKFQLQSSRRLDKVGSVDDSVWHRRLQQVTSTYQVTTNGTFLRSQGGESSPNLVEASARGKGRSRRALSSGRPNESRSLQSGGESCFCTILSVENGVSAPREDDFVRNLNETVVELSATGQLSNVKGVVGATEVKIQACEGLVESFSAVLFMELEADAGNVKVDELDLLGAVFGSTYNDLQTEYCDPLQRTVTTAKFQLQSSRRLDKVGSVDDSVWHRRLQQVTSTYQVTTNGTFLRSQGGESSPNLVEASARGKGRSRRALSAGRPNESRSLQSGGESCFCTILSVENGVSAPRQDDFVGNLNETVVELSAAGQLPNVNGVLSFSEIVDVSCVGKVENFVSFVLVDISADANNVKGIELELLGKIFQATYNDLQTGEYCDPLKRSIDQASFELRSTRSLSSRLPAFHDKHLGRGLRQITSTYRVNVSGTFLTGNGTKGSPMLLEISGERATGGGRMLQKSYSRHAARFLEMNKDVCLCTQFGIVNGLTAPRQNDFVESFNTSIVDLAISGELENVKGIAKLNEVLEVECSGDTDQFDVTLFADFIQKDGTSAMMSELQLLSAMFGDAYNRLQAKYCDPLFRRIENVSIGEPISVRRLGDVKQSRDRRVQQVTSTYQVNASVSFIRGFNTNIDRLELLERAKQRGRELFLGSDRILQNEAEGGLCFCTTASTAKGLSGPRNDDFVAFYNDIVVALAAAGELAIVVGVSGVVEPFLTTQSPRPTDGPSSYPSLIPSNSPSFFPSREPSSSPSKSPSISVQPSPSPSSSINLCAEGLLQVRSILQIEMNGDISPIAPETIAAAFEEAFNSLRTNECNNHAAGVSVLRLDSRRFDEFRRLQNPTDLVTTIIKVEVNWQCPQTENCDPVNVLRGKDPAVLALRLTEELGTLAPDSGASADGLAVETPPPSQSPSTTHPSSIPSGLPSIIPSLSIQPSDEDIASASPSSQPSVDPSEGPSLFPSLDPSEEPSLQPSSNPPSSAPTERILCVESETDQLIVFQDFEDFRWDGWSNGKIEKGEQAFTTFLGRYSQGEAFPSRTFLIPPLGINRLYVSFDFYEIDGWDGDGSGGVDTFSVAISGDVDDEINFGWFKCLYSEPSTSGRSEKGLIAWEQTSDAIADSPQGFSDTLSDQRHFIFMEIPPLFVKMGGQLTITIKWSLQATVDEYVGIDNFKVLACRDITPSSVPSLIPSGLPSSSPSLLPSSSPSLLPSTSPSLLPSLLPSTSPSLQPSDVPSYNCGIQLPGYTFYEDKESLGGTFYDGKITGDQESEDGRLDPVYTSLQQMAAICTSYPNCKAVTTEGYMKYGIKPERDWVTKQVSQFELYPLCYGMYVKTPEHDSCVPNGCDYACEQPGYRHFPGQSSDGGDLINGRGRERINPDSSDVSSFDRYRQACDSIDGNGCTGFSILDDNGFFGLLKHNIKQQYLWGTAAYVLEQCKGIWIKESKVDACIAGNCYCAVPDGYTFYPYMKPGYNGRHNRHNLWSAATEPLSESCDNIANCKGFTNFQAESRFAYAIDESVQWDSINGDAAGLCTGLFVKTARCSGFDCGYCGGGDRRNGICLDGDKCCDAHGYCCGQSCGVRDPVFSLSYDCCYLCDCNNDGWCLNNCCRTAANCIQHDECGTQNP